MNSETQKTEELTVDELNSIDVYAEIGGLSPATIGASGIDRLLDDLADSRNAYDRAKVVRDIMGRIAEFD